MTVSSAPTRVLVVDDHPAICEALAAAIRSTTGMELCGQVHSVAQAMALLQQDAPDVAVVDLSLGDGHGLDLVQHIRSRHPDTEVVVFSMYDEEVYAERALRAGASGYLMKNVPVDRVMEAIHEVARGDVYLSRRMATRVLSQYAGRGSGEPTFAIQTLTDREMIVFQLLGEGQSTDEIADLLHLSRKTVETYRRRAKEKLGFETVNDLLQFAVQWVHGQHAPLPSRSIS